jgi:hypothetical protein
MGPVKSIEIIKQIRSERKNSTCVVVEDDDETESVSSPIVVRNLKV